MDDKKDNKFENSSIVTRNSKKIICIIKIQFKKLIDFFKKFKRIQGIVLSISVMLVVLIISIVLFLLFYKVDSIEALTEYNKNTSKELVEMFNESKIIGKEQKKKREEGIEEEEKKVNTIEQNLEKIKKMIKNENDADNLNELEDMKENLEDNLKETNNLIKEKRDEFEQVKNDLKKVEEHSQKKDWNCVKLIANKDQEKGSSRQVYNLNKKYRNIKLAIVPLSLNCNSTFSVKVNKRRIPLNKLYNYTKVDLKGENYLDIEYVFNINGHIEEEVGVLISYKFEKKQEFLKDLICDIFSNDQYKNPILVSEGVKEEKNYFDTITSYNNLAAL